MATRFEIVLCGSRPVALRAAGEEALDEIRRVEAALSFYRPESQIAAVNRAAAERPVPVSAEVVEVIRSALELSAATHGAFDITVAPLLKAWGMTRGSGSLPDPAELALARECVGWRWVEWSAPPNAAIRFKRPGVMLDLGSIGKGYALDRAADVLREAGVTDALLHGGTSTAIGMGRPEDGEAWKVAIPRPLIPEEEPVRDPADLPPLAVVELRDESLSVSAVWGKGFTADGRHYGHVIDPALGAPAQGALLAAVVLPSAMESDALSTALLVRGRAMLDRWQGAPEALRCLVAERAENGGYTVATKGISASVE